MLNKEIYEIGREQFNKYFDRNRLDRLTEEEYDEVLENLAWNAVYNDNYKVETDEFGYYIVAEVEGIDEANEYLEFRHEA